MNNENPESMMVEKFNAPSKNLGRDPWLGATVFPSKSKARAWNMPCVNMDKKVRNQGQGNIWQGRGQDFRRSLFVNTS